MKESEGSIKLSLVNEEAVQSMSQTTVD